MAVRLRRHPSLSPEHTLLLTCARSTLRPDHLAQIRKVLGDGIDWNFFWPLVRAHGVGYFVGNHLCPTPVKPTDGGTWALSPQVLNRIQQDLWQETAHALLLREQQLRLNGELARAGLHVLWLKGLVLAERLYGRFEARHCGDLDLLADPSDVPKVEELLARLDFERYRPAESGKEFHPLAAHHSMWCANVLPDWRLIVELHHRLSGPVQCQPSVTDLVRRSRLVEFQGQEMRVASMEDELLILCLHAHHHNFALLRCLMDVAEFVRRFHDQIDWPGLVERAWHDRCLGRLRAALEICDALLELEYRVDVFVDVPSLTSRQRWVIRSLPVAALLDPRTQQDDFRQAQLALLMDSWGDAVRSLSPRLFPSRDHVRSLSPPFCRRAPGMAQVCYYIRFVGQVFRRWSPGFTLRTR